MGREETLKRVETEIEMGELGKARDRLQGLLLTYPDDLEIRRLLGEVFWRLQYPEKAGQYWYLLAPDTEEMRVARQAFERRHGGSSGLMLYELRFRGGLESIAGTFAEHELDRLAKAACVSRSQLEELVARKKDSRLRPNLREVSTKAAGGGGIILVLVLMVIGIINGVITVFRWLF